MKHLIYPAGGALMALLLTLTPCSGAIITTNLTSYGSDPAGLTVTLDDSSMPGFLTVSGSVGSDPVGDIRGLFLEISSDLSGFDINNDVQDPDGIITERAFNTNSLSGGNNLQGEIDNLGFNADLAFGFGSPGIGTDDIQSFTLKLANLTVSDVTGVAARVTSVGSPGSARSGSDKLFSPDTDFQQPPTPPNQVPEPAAVTLMGLGLLALAWSKSRSSRR